MSDYGLLSGVWGYKGHEKTDKVHMRAIRSFLGVNKFAPLCGMGWTPPVIRLPQLLDESLKCFAYGTESCLLTISGCPEKYMKLC